MRKKATQYLAVLFCLLVIGQDFCSGRVADEIIKRSKIKREALEESEEKTGDANVESTELALKDRKKRNAAGILFGVAFLVSVGSAGFQLYLAENEGCCELYSSICRDEKKFIKYKKLLNQTSNEIDLLYLDAEILFEWAQNINYRVQEMWLKIERISGLNDQIVRGINPAIINQLEIISEDIEDEIEANNETTLAYTNADLNLRYTSVWDNTNTALQSGFYFASFPLSLLAQRLINYLINRSITKFAATLQTTYGPILQNSLAGNGKAASFFGVRNAADVDANVLGTAKAIQQGQWAKTSTWGPRIVNGLTIVTSLATIALEAWTLYTTWTECEKLAGKVGDTADDIKEAYEDNLDLNVTVSNYLANITYYYDDIRDQLTGEELDLALEEIKNITLYAANAERMKQATDAINEWFANIDEADESDTYELLGTLNAGLANVSYTLECYRDKYRAITYISEHCAAGDDTLPNLYDTATADFFLNEADCIDDEGYKYTTYDNIEEIIEGLAESEGYNADCILNSETKLNTVCTKYWDGYSNATIMDEESLTADQLDYLLGDCGVKPVTPNEQATICTYVSINDTSNGVFTVSFIASTLQLTEEQVEDAIENCNEESTTTDSFTEAPTTTLAPTTTQEPTTTLAPTEAPTTTEATTTTTTTKAPATVASSSRRRRRRRRRRRGFFGL